MKSQGLMGRVNRRRWEDEVWDRSRDTIMCKKCGRFIMRKDTISGLCVQCYYKVLKEIARMVSTNKEQDEYPELEPPED